MKKMLYVLLLCPVMPLFSQGVVDVDKGNSTTIRNGLFYLRGGSPVPSTKYVRVVSGSPYFSDSLMKGSLVLVSGTRIDSILVRFDLLDNSIQYISGDGTELIASIPFRSLTLRDTVSGKQYDFVYSAYMPVKPEKQGWYQALTYGNATLYKRIAKRVSESKAYMSSLTEQSIYTTEEYYLFFHMTFTRIKKPEELPELLGKRKELFSLINSKKLTGKSEQDFIDVVNEYNKLIEQ